MSSPQRSGPGIPPGEGADCAAPVFAASHPLAERIKELNSLCGISKILRALREAGGNRTKPPDCWAYPAALFSAR
jgi:hypothetical protein